MRDWGRIVTIIVVPAFITLAVWWLESRFDALVAVLVIGTLVGALFFTAGAFLSHMIAKSTMQSITSFAQRDAQTDRYRQQSFKALAQGESAMQRAAAQLTVLDAKRVDGLAQQRARMLAVPAPVAEPPTGDVWSWDDDGQPADSGASFAVWE
jgi:hypothetical protein